MVNRLLHIGLLLVLGSCPSRALAHGGNASVQSVLATDGRGAVHALRLDEGLALRHADSWRYICPAQWGDDEQTPAAGAVDGPIIIAGRSGLQLLHLQDGAVRPHPVPLTQSGQTLALRATSHHVLQLRTHQDLTQVVEIGRDEARVIYSDVAGWTALEVTPTGPVLARLEASRVELLLLSPDGDVLDRLSADAPEGTVDVRPRAVGDAMFIVALVDGGLRGVLGQIVAGTWQTLHTATGTLLGPVDDGKDGAALLLAAGGRLARLQDGGVQPLDGPDGITCVGAHGELRYACVADGLVGIGAMGAGAELFRFAELEPPVLESLAEDTRAQCERQWLRYTLDLRALGVDATASRPGEDAGMGAGVGDESDAGGPPDPDAGAHDHAAAEHSASARTGRGSGGCSPAPGSTAHAAPWLLVLCLCLWRRRRSHSTS